MTAMRDAMRKALAKKRAEVIAQRGPTTLDIGEPDDNVTIKYVRCDGCMEMLSYEAFLYHGARLPSCKCKGGREDYVTFELTVKKAEDKV